MSDTKGKLGKMVTFRRPQGLDRVIIPMDDDPEKHVRPELIVSVAEVTSLDIAL